MTGSATENPSRVAIVEDEVQLADLFEAWLQDSYTVVTAHDCATAREVLDDTVDVALLDRQLPDGAGDDVLTTIRDRGLDCRVAMVTATEPDLDIVDMEFDDYLRKPVKRTELLGTVNRLCSQSQFGPPVNELYTLAVKKALLESTTSHATLAETDDYVELVDRYNTLQAALDTVSDTINVDQYTAVASRAGVADD